MSRRIGPDWLVLYERARPRLTVKSVFGELRCVRSLGSRLRAACPLHGGQNRNFAIETKTLAWMCHSKCEEGGGPIEFVHRQLGRSGPPRGRQWIEAAEVLCRRVDVLPVAESAPARISLKELSEVWLLTRPVTSDQGVASWLQNERALDPQLIADHELARVLPVHHALPRWAGFEREGRWHPWPRHGYRIVVPLYDCSGRLRSLRFRAPRPGAKARPASGVTGIGLVMADPLARSVLARGEAPPHLQGEELSVVIAEGEPDFWSWATEPARRGLGDSARTFPAVLGVVSGSFDESIATRLPACSHFISAIHRDAGGDRIHAAIAQRLAAAGRNYRLTRWSDDHGEEA